MHDDVISVRGEMVGSTNICAIPPPTRDSSPTPAIQFPHPRVMPGDFPILLTSSHHVRSDFTMRSAAAAPEIFSWAQLEVVARNWKT